MSYPGIAFVLMVGVAVGTAIYYYFNGDWKQGPNQHNAHGYRNEYNDYPFENASSKSSSRSSPDSTKKRKKAVKYEDCTICLQLMKPYSTKTLTCGHVYHTTCIKTWLESNKTCPVCRCDQIFT